MCDELQRLRELIRADIKEIKNSTDTQHAAAHGPQMNGYTPHHSISSSPSLPR